jgi:hypothetical protein
MESSRGLRSPGTGDVVQRPANVRKQEKQDEGENSGSSAVRPQSAACGARDDSKEGKCFAEPLPGEWARHAGVF